MIWVDVCFCNHIKELFSRADWFSNHIVIISCAQHPTTSLLFARKKPFPCPESKTRCSNLAVLFLYLGWLKYQYSIASATRWALFHVTLSTSSASWTVSAVIRAFAWNLGVFLCMNASTISSNSSRVIQSTAFCTLGNVICVYVVGKEKAKEKEMTREKEKRVNFKINGSWPVFKMQLLFT